MTQRKHTAVSLPTELMDLIRKDADASNRSMAKQIEHYMQIANTVETILPVATVNDVKAKKYSARELLLGLVKTLEEGVHTTEAYKRIVKENPRRVHFDSNDHTVAYLTDDTKGTVTKGRLTEQGDFIADTV